MEFKLNVVYLVRVTIVNQMTKKLNIQYVTDNNGNKTAVLIPIDEWKSLQEEMSEFIEYQSLKKSLSSAFIEVEKLRLNPEKKISLTDFLNDC